MSFVKYMHASLHPQDLNSIFKLIHHSMVAINIFPLDNIFIKPYHKGENATTNNDQASHDPNSNAKNKEKGVYKEKSKISPKDLEKHKKDDWCF